MVDDITDSKSWLMLMTWETEGEDGILGMKRDTFDTCVHKKLSRYWNNITQHQWTEFSDSSHKHFMSNY